MNFYHKFKLAYRGNIPLMEDPDAKKDPYRKNTPGDGKGTKLTMPGDEETSGSMGGSRARGETFPNVSQTDDYELQRKRDIPNSPHQFMGDDELPPMGEGANDDRFMDERDKTVDIFNGRTDLGIQNLQRPNILNRIRNRIRGV